MLKTVFARAGSDVTAFLCENIKESLAATNRKVMLVIPEQASFETEKVLYLALGDELFSKVEVVSFTNLCRLVKRIYGGTSQNRLSPAGKIILSATAAEKAVPELCVYQNQTSNNAFLERVASVIDEIKAASISADIFSQKIQNPNLEENLKAKLSDISKIYSWYDALVSQGFVDPSDELSFANERLKNGELFASYDIIINEFSSFNRSQREIIKKMLINSPSVTLVLTAKPENNGVKVLSFKAANETYRRLKSICNENAVAVGAVQVLNNTALFENEDLICLEKLLAGEQIQQSSTENVFVYSSPNIKKECRFISAEILRLVMSEGYRFKDIAVVTRDLEGYLPHIEDSFRIFGISYFADMRVDLDTRPIVVLILSLLETIMSGFDPQKLITYLKCPISPICFDDATLLENYIELWSVSKSQILSDFDKNPYGISSTMDMDALKLLEKINQIIADALSPLLQLKKSLSNANGGKISREIYEFLQQNKVLEKLSEYTNSLAQSDTPLAAEQHRAFKICIDAISQLGILLENEKVTIKRYLELFKMAINASDVGSVPHHIDEVMVGSADRMRIGNVKAVFVLGLNETLFPKRHTEDGIFSDTDRKAVREANIEILAPSSVLNENEHFYLYSAVTSASSRVYLSYPKKAVGGEILPPSKIVETVKQNLKIEEKITTQDDQEFFGTDEAAFELLCNHYNENSDLANSLREYFMSKADSLYRIRMLNIDKGMRNRESQISEVVANRLYGDEMQLSPTQIERYHLCKFSHFCKYALALSPENRAEVGRLDNGMAIHMVLERLLQNYSKDEIAGMSDKSLEQKIEEYLLEFMRVQIGVSAFTDNRTNYSIMRLKTTIAPVIKYIISELSYSGFTPRDFELEIRKNKDLEPYVIKSENGVSLSVAGQVDRVDTLEQDGKTYVRVIDYKSSGKVYKQDELSYGLNLQMFLYLFSIWENGGKRYGKNVTPSGVLYMPTKRPDMDISGSQALENSDVNPVNNIKMNGIILDEDKIKKEETNKFCAASVGDISEFEAIKNQTEKLLCKMADELRLGSLSISPLYSGNDNLGCRNCDYRMICGFEEGDMHRTIQKPQKESKVQENG